VRVPIPFWAIRCVFFFCCELFFWEGRGGERGGEEQTLFRGVEGLGCSSWLGGWGRGPRGGGVSGYERESAVAAARGGVAVDAGKTSRARSKSKGGGARGPKRPYAYCLPCLEEEDDLLHAPYPHHLPSISFAVPAYLLPLPLTLLPSTSFTNPASFFLSQRLVRRGHGPDGCGGGGAVPRGSCLEVSWFVLFSDLGFFLCGVLAAPAHVSSSRMSCIPHSPPPPIFQNSTLTTLFYRYVVRLLGWARKYGIRVNLDLHTAPGSQNGVFSFSLIWYSVRAGAQTRRDFAA
jgi:hypothetical protein